MRWYWGKRHVRTEVCEGLLLPQLQMLLAEPGIEAQRIVRRPMLQSEQQALAKTPEGRCICSQGAPAEYWSATITRNAAAGLADRRARAGRLRLGRGGRHHRGERAGGVPCADGRRLRPDRDGPAGGSGDGAGQQRSIDPRPHRGDRAQLGAGLQHHQLTTAERPLHGPAALCRGVDQGGHRRRQPRRAHPCAYAGQCQQPGAVGADRRDAAGVLHAVSRARARHRQQPGRHGDGPAADRKPRDAGGAGFASGSRCFRARPWSSARPTWPT